MCYFPRPVNPSTRACYAKTEQLCLTFGRSIASPVCEAAVDDQGNSLQYLDIENRLVPQPINEWLSEEYMIGMYELIWLARHGVPESFAKLRLRVSKIDVMVRPRDVAGIVARQNYVHQQLVDHQEYESQRFSDKEQEKEEDMEQQEAEDIQEARNRGDVS